MGLGLIDPLFRSLYSRLGGMCTGLVLHGIGQRKDAITVTSE